MRKMRSFRCTNCEAVEEHLIEDEVEVIRCDICGDSSVRFISGGHFSLDPISGHFPSTTQQWAKNRQIQIAAERKANS